MTIYAEDHASALADVQEAGTAVTFTRTANDYAPTTGVSVITETTVEGYAIRDKGNPLTYQALGLRQSEAPTLFFVPTTQGELPAPGDAVTWRSLVFTVRDVLAIEPDGDPIAAYVVISR